MSEQERTPIADYIGSVKITSSETEINGRAFKNVIGVIGGATGLEALNIAASDSSSAVVIVDPLVKFYQEVAKQLESMQQQPTPHHFNWNVILNDPQLRGLNEIFWDIGYGLTGTKIDQLLLSFKEGISEYSSRIFCVPAMTSEVTTNPIFNHIDLIYPYPKSVFDQSIKQFISESLRQNGTFRVVTEKPAVAYSFIQFAGSQLTECGFVHRDSKKKENNSPLSLYDSRFGKNGFFYVTARKTGDFPEYYSLDIAGLRLVEQLPSDFSYQSKLLTEDPYHPSLLATIRKALPKRIFHQ